VWYSDENPSEEGGWRWNRGGMFSGDNGSHDWG
jgi:hypothetical protein